MDKKKTIQIIIVVVCFSAMGIVLYNSFFGGSGAATTPNFFATTASITPTSVLPYGPTFDYQKIDDLQKQGFVYGQIQYPVLSTSTDVGKPSAADLIQPLPQASTP